jgi:hypothetical protein
MILEFVKLIKQDLRQFLEMIRPQGGHFFDRFIEENARFKNHYDEYFEILEL